MAGLYSFARAAVFLCCAVLALSAAVPRAAAGTLYGLTSSSPGSIYTLDTFSGGASLLRNISNATSRVGLASLNGQLYATDVATFSGFAFGSINLTTGAFTFINNQ